MNKFLPIALLVGGIVHIVYGMSASQSLGSDFSRFFTGAPTDKSLWFLVGGVIAAALGIGSLIRGTRFP